MTALSRVGSGGSAAQPMLALLMASLKRSPVWKRASTNHPFPLGLRSTTVVDGVLNLIPGSEDFPDTSAHQVRRDGRLRGHMAPTSRSPAMKGSTLIADRASVSIP